MDSVRAPVELPDGSVAIPASLAAEVLHLLAVALVHEARDTGAQPSAAAARLFRDLHHATRHPPTPPARFADEPPTAAPGIVEIDSAQAAAVLGSTAQHVTRLCRSGRILGRRIGRTWLIDQASLDAYRFGRSSPT